jgi:polysaccharide biosynthesis transport protein
MNDKINGSLPQTSGITRDDVMFILSRHKWKIGIISTVAILAAASVYFFWPLPYRSEARLLIKYVVDTKSPGQMGGSNSKVSSPDDRGDTVLVNEMENLGSFDIALEVAKTIGPSNILAKAGGGADLAAAASLIRKNLLLDVPRRSSVIHLVFQHNDPTIVQPVLNSLIEEYYKKHVEIHRDLGQLGDFLTQQTDQLHSKLIQTEQALRDAKTNAGVISVEDTKKVYSEQMARIQDALLQAEADLAERQAAAAEVAKLTHSELPVMTNTTAATNDAQPPSDKLAEYKRISSLLDRLSARQQELLLQFTPENSWVKQVGEQIAANEQLRQKLEEAYPSLVATKALLPKTDFHGNAQPDLTTELARVSGLQSKIKILTQQLNDIQRAAGKMYASEASISDLQRKYFLQETQYNYFSMSLEQSRIDEALGASRVSNISRIQAPTPPGRDYSKLQKVCLAILGAGLGLAFGLAFLIEFYLDRSIKRPLEIENKLGLPLFISIPRVNLGKRQRLPQGKIPLLSDKTAKNVNDTPHSSPNSATNGDSKSELAVVKSSANGGAVAPWDPRYILRPFCQALRDNLITFFEVNNLTHKPKLVAVTSCARGTGVSTIAAGLAASLSETGEGNVLLVNMNQTTDGAVQQFYKGHLACDLDAALGPDTRDHALVQGNLYVANESNHDDNLPVILPKRFKNLVPKLRASDYDYIIFDMPEVSQISPTQRLARFMDMVLMVVESEKTNMDTAKRVSSMLVSTKTNIAVVLNKTRDPLPEHLQPAA